jgi:hypothetical protein
MPNIRLEAIDGKHDLPLLFEAPWQSLLVLQMKHNPFLIALKQMGHRPLGDLDTSIT